jgi:hypothetical protein
MRWLGTIFLASLAILFASQVCVGSYRLYRTSQDSVQTDYLVFALQAGNIGERLSLFESDGEDGGVRDNATCVALHRDVSNLAGESPASGPATIAIELNDSADEMAQVCRSAASTRPYRRLENHGAIARQRKHYSHALTTFVGDFQKRYPGSLAALNSLLYLGHPMFATTMAAKTL